MRGLLKGGLGLGMLASATLAFEATAAKVFLAVGSVLAIAFFVVRGWRGGYRRERQALKLLSRVTLGPHTGLALVEVRSQRYLVSFGEGIPKLCSLQPQAPSPEEREVESLLEQSFLLGARGGLQ